MKSRDLVGMEVAEIESLNIFMRKTAVIKSSKDMNLGYLTDMDIELMNKVNSKKDFLIKLKRGTTRFEVFIPKNKLVDMTVNDKVIKAGKVVVSYAGVSFNVKQSDIDAEVLDVVEIQ